MNYKILIGLMLVSMLLLTGCESPYKDVYMGREYIKAEDICSSYCNGTFSEYDDNSVYCDSANDYVFYKNETNINKNVVCQEAYYYNKSEHERY